MSNESEIGSELKQTYLILFANVSEREDVAFWLERAGIRVVAVGTKEEAVRLAEHFIFPAVLISGLFASEWNLEICRELLEITADTPIIFYANYAPEVNKQNALAAGAADFLVHTPADQLAAIIGERIAAKAERGL